MDDPLLKNEVYLIGQLNSTISQNNAEQSNYAIYS